MSLWYRSFRFEIFLPPPFFSCRFISVCSISMSQGCILGGVRGCCIIENLSIICLVCGLLSSLLGVVLWFSHFSRDSSAPECVFTLECHRVILFSGQELMRVLRLCLFGCFMGGLRLEVLCRGRGIRYTGIFLMSLLWKRGGIQLIYLLWFEIITMHSFSLCVLI